MRSVRVDADAAVMHEIVQIAADLRPALEDQHVAAGIGQGAGDRRAGQSGADDQVIDDHACFWRGERPTSRALSSHSRSASASSSAAGSGRAIRFFTT